MLLDIAFIISVVYGIYQGFIGGFFNGIFKVLRYILGVFLAMKSSYLIMDYMTVNTDVETAYLPLFAFILMYILVMGLMTAVTSIVNTINPYKESTYFSRGGGVLIWIFVLSFLFSAIIAFGEQSGIMSPRMLASSSVYPYIVDVYPVVKCRLYYLIPAFGNIIDSFQNLFADLARQLRGGCYP